MFPTVGPEVWAKNIRPGAGRHDGGVDAGLAEAGEFLRDGGGDDDKIGFAEKRGAGMQVGRVCYARKRGVCGSACRRGLRD